MLVENFMDGFFMCCIYMSYVFDAQESIRGFSFARMFLLCIC